MICDVKIYLDAASQIIEKCGVVTPYGGDITGESGIVCSCVSFNLGLSLDDMNPFLNSYVVSFLK